MTSFLKTSVMLLVSALVAGCQTQSATQSQPAPAPPPTSQPSSHTSPSASTAQASPTDGASRSHEDAASELEERLATSVSEFDRMILDERARIGSGFGGDDEQPSGPGSNTHGDGSWGDDDYGGSLTGGSADDAAETANDGALTEHDGPATRTPPGASTAGVPASDGGAGEHDAVPGDIPSGEDDDIVARQIREAAINEPDPELREKLWDEYRRYKGLKP